MENMESYVSNVHLSDLLPLVGVGTWDWDLTTGAVNYSPTWAGILGYAKDELPQVVGTWERMVLPADLEVANQKIEDHLSGKMAIYEAEFRMVCKNGSIIWAQDKGRVTQRDKEGRPIRFMGVLQDVTRMKDTELRLLKNQETLDLAVNVAELGTWDWDISGNRITYNNEYLKMLGYRQEEVDGSMEEWESMNHPEDLPHSMKLLNAYIAGERPSYECIIRMEHRDGSYIWTRDVGKIVEWDTDGTPIRLIGGHLNIDGLKRSEEQLTEALTALEHNNLTLESEVERRTEALLEQDKMLWTVNQISRKLLTFHQEEGFDDLVRECLSMLGESINRNRIYIWKDHIGADDRIYCTQIYEWVRGAKPIQGEEQYESIPYDEIPSFAAAVVEDRCINSLLWDLSDGERNILEPQGVKTILIAPVYINGKRWGFIGADNCETEELFSRIEESMLQMSGSLLANSIEKMETEAKLREMEERTQIMLNAMPLCCNLWNSEMKNMSCNDEAVRLYDLSSQQEYLERFHELSPKYQPCGRNSGELAREYIGKAFAEGWFRFEWLHQKLDGTLIPAEITLVRIKYRDSFIVAGYTRDLRKQRAMIAELQSKEDDLRNARDEALLSSKAKSNFLANMSHEIRTPMNAISGLTEIILRESGDSRVNEYAQGIKSACGNLLNIINDILDISKIESGKLEIFSAPYEMASLLNDVLTIAQMRLGKKPLMLVTNIDSHLPAQLVGDEFRIKQILINMLSNAIKFTQEGYISLRVSGTVEEGRATLRFSVKDSGVGIKAEDLKRLFAEFERVNTTKNRSIEGTGLGLAISKQLCEMMHGTIEVESVYGKGSEFVATLPQECQSYERLCQVQQEKSVLLYEPRESYRNSIAESLENLDCKCVPCANQSELYDSLGAMNYNYILTAALHLKKVQTLAQKHQMAGQIVAFADYGETVEDNTAYSISFPISCLQLAHLLNGHYGEGEARQSNRDITFTAPNARVLVVDDNKVNLQVARGLMEPYGFIVDTADGGRESIKMIKQTEYDLVFMDHMMPEMDGIDTTAAIRQLSGSYYKNLPIIALTANALVGTREMFIREGMNDFLAKPIELNKLGNILLRWLPNSKIVKASIKDPKASAALLPTWDLAGINTVQGILSVGGSRANYLQILLAYYKDGKEKCISLLTHNAQKDLGAFRTEVHALKSTSATIGAHELSTWAAKLEAAAQEGDSAFIDAHLDEFLTALHNVLEAILSILPTTLVDDDEVKKMPLPKGDPGELQELLSSLKEGAEFANISVMEADFSKLRQFRWSEEITKELNAIEACLQMFDYDEALECVLRLSVYEKD